MAGSLNKVQLIGRLGADPEIKQMVNGKNVARLSIATSQSWKDKNSGEDRHRPVIRVDRLNLLGSRKDSETNSNFSSTNMESNEVPF